MGSTLPTQEKRAISELMSPKRRRELFRHAIARMMCATREFKKRFCLRVALISMPELARAQMLPRTAPMPSLPAMIIYAITTVEATRRLQRARR